MNASIVLGVDIGGSHIATALVDRHRKAIVKGSCKRKAVNAQATSDDILQTWCDAIQQCFSNGIVTTKIGIAMPGPFDYENGISLMKDNNKYAALYGLNVKELLAQKLAISSSQISFINDAGAFIEGEIFAGAGKTYLSAIGLTLGTGLGTATYKNGIGKDANLWCMPFKDGIAEDYISTKWFEATYFKLSGKQVQGVKSLALQYDNDTFIQSLFKQFAENFADFLRVFVQANNPDLIIIGGNIMNAETLFMPVVINHLQQQGITVPIVRAKLGEDAAILGAVAYMC
ncbi:MAG: ROK family protein [Flavobacterium sp.]|nr:ROK family protein [Flavobacterium sp.]